ncbi:MAG TPA: serine/threonine-protein kinase, partial [Byssovorax sp.]
MSLRPGTRLGGDYVVGRALAQGGMGAVYSAVQESTGAERALKVMHPSLVGEPRLRAMFDREARASARIASDHVVQVLAAGVDADTGSPWLVMELLDGETLAQAIDRAGALPFDDVRRIVSELCHGLGAAHTALEPLVHRDLKPENVFLARTKRRDGAWSVKLLDFGIAKVIDDARGAGTTMPAGTPMWMAPEQSEARSVVTPAADVWALGLVVFRATTGEHYWKVARRATSFPAGALLKEVLIDPIVPASERAAELGVLALLPPGFDGWFARCVDRDPAARFPDAEAARAAFERVAARATTDVFGATDPTPLAAERALAASSAAATSTNAEPLRARARRRTWLVAAAGALMIAAALAAVLRPASKPATAQKYPPDLRRSETLMWARAVLDAAPPDEQSRGTRIQALEDIVTSRLVTPEMKQSAATKLADIPPTALDPDIIRSVVREQAMPLM